MHAVVIEEKEQGMGKGAVMWWDDRIVSVCCGRVPSGASTWAWSFGKSVGLHRVLLEDSSQQRTSAYVVKGHRELAKSALVD